MKFFPNLLVAVEQALQLIFFDRRYADKVIERTLKSDSRWGARDRKFIAESVYDMVRWWTKIHYACKITHPAPENTPKLVAAYMYLQYAEVPQFYKDIELDLEQLTSRWTDASAPDFVKMSIPQWLDAKGKKYFNDEWQSLMQILNTQAPLVLRTNTLKASRRELLAQLRSEGIDATPLSWNEEGVVISEKTNIFQLNSFKEGWFEVQDAGSQKIAEYLEVRPGMRVVDACAGAGGKALHLASLMENKGSILALDKEAWKLDELKKRARRAGAFNIQTKPIEDSKTIKRLASGADRLLLDVPCSGLGVLRRNPDTKWKINESFVEEIKILQAQLLDLYPSMLRPGGLLVYATCSIFPDENQDQVEVFLKNHPEFTLVKQQTILPSEGFDGFYMAQLLKG